MLDIYRVDEQLYNPWTMHYELLSRWYCGNSTYTLAIAERGVDGRYVVGFRLPGCEVNDQILTCDINAACAQVRHILDSWLSPALPGLRELGFKFAGEMGEKRSIQ